MLNNAARGVSEIVRRVFCGRDERRVELPYTDGFYILDASLLTNAVFFWYK
jgi:hypothetical protein